MVTVLSVAVALLVIVSTMRWLSTPVPGHAMDPQGVRLALWRLAQDDRELPSLTVTYSDLHGFHGGLSLTIRGDGKSEQTAVRTAAGVPKDRVRKEDIQRLISLLNEIQAWEQRVPQAMPIPDESRAHVRISIGDKNTVIWERYNDLKTGQRIIRVRELMKEIAWLPAAKSSGASDGN